MVMSSQQIAGMLQQQNGMFAGMASYAQQITPPMGMAPGMGAMGGSPMMYNQGPAPMSPPMPVQSAWNPGSFGGMTMPFGPPHAGGAQAFGESALATGFSGLNTATQGLGMMSGMAGLGSMGLGMMGVGGSLATGLSVAGSAPVALGLGAGAHAASNMYTGFQQRQGVNQVLRSRFGNVMGVGHGRGGSGFSSGEMGGISSMMREMGTEDLTTNMEELTRVMDKTAGMGLYRGVQSAREFKQKFQSTVDSLKEISEIMHTTLEGATNFLGQARGMGFFTGQDISKQLAATRVMSSATGMSIDQTTSMAQQGASLARATGGRGRHGAQAGLVAGGRVAMAQSMGVLDDESMAFATGGLTGAEGAQAFSGAMQQQSMRFMSRGAGRAMVAGLWGGRGGGIDQDRLNAVMSGEMNIRDLRRVGRQNIRETGGRNSEFFRDEEQLRSQVLSQGGEYLPMAIYGTHLAERRGLSMDDPIVQRQMRRRFRGMSQGQVEVATKMMQNMPQIQANMITKGRLIRDQESQGAGKETSGLSGLGRRLGQVWEKNVENPFRQFADDLTTDVTKGIEGIVDTMEGRISTQMSSASKQLIMERSEFGRAVSSSATRAAQFGQADYQKFMGTSISAGQVQRTQFTRDMGAMLGMRQDTQGRGQQAYERSFDIAGSGIAAGARALSHLSPIVGAGRMTGLLGGEASSGNLFKGSDVSLGLRSIAQDTGIEGALNEFRGYDPENMTRMERAKSLGFTGKVAGESVTDFLRGASAQMKRDVGYDAETQKRMGTEYADIMYSSMANSSERAAWRKSYQRSFGGVTNVLARAERMGSPELRAAARKMRGKNVSKAEKVAFVRSLEKGGEVAEDFRVTDELSEELGEDFGMYEEDVANIRGRREDAYGALEGSTQKKRATSGARGFGAWLAGGTNEVAGLLGGPLGYGAARASGIEEGLQDLIGGGGAGTGIGGADMERFLSDEGTREDYIKMTTGEGEEKAAAIRRFEAAAGRGGTMSASNKETYRNIRDVMSDKSNKIGNKALKSIAVSFNAEDYRTRIEVESDMGKQLEGALKSASLTALGDEGRSAFEQLQNVAKLRASGDPEKIAQSYEDEARLMEEITGSDASKQLRKALRGKEGAEFFVAGLEGAEGYARRFGAGKRGRRMSQQTKISNIMQTMLSTENISLSDASVLEAFDAKSSKDILRVLSKGGAQSQEAIEKILDVAKDSGVTGNRFERLQERLRRTGDVLEDKKVSEDEAESLAGGLGGRIAGSARSKSDATKTATADGQKAANKHLATIATAVNVLAARSSDIEISGESIAKLKKAMQGTKAGN